MPALSVLFCPCSLRKLDQICRSHQPVYAILVAGIHIRTRLHEESSISDVRLRDLALAVCREAMQQCQLASRGELASAPKDQQYARQFSRRAPHGVFPHVVSLMCVGSHRAPAGCYKRRLRSPVLLSCSSFWALLHHWAVARLQDWLWISITRRLPQLQLQPQTIRCAAFSVPPLPRLLIQ